MDSFWDHSLHSWCFFNSSRRSLRLVPPEQTKWFDEHTKATDRISPDFSTPSSTWLPEAALHGGSSYQPGSPDGNHFRPFAWEYLIAQYTRPLTHTIWKRMKGKEWMHNNMCWRTYIILTVFDSKKIENNEMCIWSTPFIFFKEKKNAILHRAANNCSTSVVTVPCLSILYTAVRGVYILEHSAGYLPGRFPPGIHYYWEGDWSLLLLLFSVMSPPIHYVLPNEKKKGWYSPSSNETRKIKQIVLLSRTFAIQFQNTSSTVHTFWSSLLPGNDKK